MRLIFAILIMLSMNVVLAMFNSTVMNVASAEGITTANDNFNQNTSILNQYGDGTNVYTTSNLSGLSTSSAYGSGVTTIIVDIASQMLGWIPGAKEIWQVIDAVPATLKMVGMPSEFAFFLGVLWHVITFVLIVVFIRGGGY